MRIRALLLLVVCLCVPVGQLHAQHVIRDYFSDYFVNVPRSYSPDDPWTMGKILRTEVGHGGFFYNCDSEECKRHSPYISWNRQSSDCKLRRPVRRTISQQFEEIKQRIRWGSCQTCGNDCQCNGGGCQLCQAGTGPAYADAVSNDGTGKQAELAMASRQLIDSLLHGDSMPLAEPQDSNIDFSTPATLAKSAPALKAPEVEKQEAVVAKRRGILARRILPKKTVSPEKKVSSSSTTEGGFRMLRR